MIRKTLTYLVFVLGFCSVAMGQVDTVDTGINRSGLDTTRTDTTLIDSTQAAVEEPDFKVIPWLYNTSIGSRVATTDSLLRWQNWPGWTHKKNRDHGVITYRLGTVGRTNAFLQDAHEPRHQQLYWEDMPLHDPASGTVNWSVLPQHKLYLFNEDGEGITHESNFYLKQYYLNKPLSKLIFDESKFDRRSLEFWISQNFSQKLNAEVSYWDRRGGGGYPNSSFQGNQIYSRIYYQMSNQQLFKMRFLTGKRTLGEPFGYVIPVLDNFNFDHFATSPNQASAQSESGLTTLALSYHRRAQDTTAVPENLRAGLYLKSVKRQVSYQADTTSYVIQTLGGFVHKWIEWNPFRLEGSARYELLSNKNRAESNLFINNWSLMTANGVSIFQPLEWWNIRGEATLRNRNDEYTSYSIGADMEFDLSGRIRLSGGISRGTIMPTTQQLYWNSEEYMGSFNLNNERIEEMHAMAEFTLFNSLTLGARGQLKQVDNAIFVNRDNTFVNAGEYISLSSTGYLDFESPHFELSTSATMHRYQDFVPRPGSNIPNFMTERIWLKGGAYWKGYLFNRATYVKAGLSGMFSPQRYLADHYDPVLDYWQPASDDQLIPWFSRLDFDLSARVRSIMFVVRFENILDEVNQLGYFETANYPMPPRRFLFGVRALFND